MGCCNKEGDSGQRGVIGRVFFYILGFIGLAFSLLTVFSCRFISYSTILGEIPSTLPPPFLSSGQANVGLFRWDNRDEDEEDTGCVYYTNDQIKNFDSAMRTAQIVSYVAVICAGLALFLSTIEFVCCRFCCSKFFLSFFMIFAMITQGLTFAIYVSDMCTSGRSCSMHNGAIFSIVAAGFYFVDSIIVCSTPKPTPWIKRVRAEDDDTGCLACCTKKQEPAEDIPEKTVPLQDNDAELAVAAGAAAGTAAAIGVTAAEGDDAGDEETGDVNSEIESAAVSVTPSLPSQVGEEITLELSQSMKESN